VARAGISDFWTLSRPPQMDSDRLRELVARAKALGFDTDRLILVEQDG